MRAALGIAIAAVACGHPASSAPTAASNTAGAALAFTPVVVPMRGAASVEIADVDGDHRDDLVVANLDDGTVSVLLGRGGRRFEPAPGSPFACGAMPNDVQIVDVDRDGRLDLVIANTDRQTLTILQGDGKGGFRPAPGSPVTVVVKPHVHGVAVADFDGDGHVDLATDSWGENRIVVVHGDGAGGYARPQYVETGRHPYQRLRSADLDGDGRPDLVTTDLDDDAVTVLRNDGKGGFARAEVPAGHVPFGVAIGDVDGDGHLDLAVIDSPSLYAEATGTDGLTILLGDGKGGFAPLDGSPFATGVGPSRVAIGAPGSDGTREVVVASYKSGDASIFAFAGRELRARSTVPIGPATDGAAIGDLDGDGKPDVAVTSHDDSTLTLLYQR